MIFLVSFLLIIIIVTVLTTGYVEGFETTTNPTGLQTTPATGSTNSTSPTQTTGSTNSTSPTQTTTKSTNLTTDPKYVNELVNKQNSDKEIVTTEPGSSDYLPNTSVSSYDNHSIKNATPLQKTPAMMGGFCEQNKHNPFELEKQCNSFDSKICASTNCCVLLGGDSCTAGNENGPLHKEQYNKIKNRDYYYYQGKCYGNCL